MTLSRSILAQRLICKKCWFDYSKMVNRWKINIEWPTQSNWPTWFLPYGDSRLHWYVFIKFHTTTGWTEILTDKRTNRKKENWYKNEILISIFNNVRKQFGVAVMNGISSDVSGRCVVFHGEKEYWVRIHHPVKSQSRSRFWSRKSWLAVLGRSTA